MTRTPSPASVRTLARRLWRRPTVRPGRPQTRKLRLDTLETREQPGSVNSGVAAGVLIDPLAAMTLAMGETALLPPLQPAPTSTAIGRAEPLVPETFVPTMDSDRSLADHESSKPVESGSRPDVTS